MAKPKKVLKVMATSKIFPQLRCSDRFTRLSAGLHSRP
jgi:hypothetical protein